MPTIAELIQAERDKGASYGDLSRRSKDERGKPRLGIQQLQKMVNAPMEEFPKPRTVEALSDVLQVPVATILLAFAVQLGLPVRAGGSALEIVLPPGTDVLTAGDRDAIRAVTRALVDARRSAARPVRELHPPTPDITRAAARRGESEGQRRRREQDRDAES